MKTILLVEDETLIAMNEARMLANHGYEVLTAYNAEKAIDTVNENDIDLILMDIDLGPGKMDGTEAAEIILKDHNIPVVFLSSHTEPEVVEKTEKITSYGYIVKNSGDTVLLASLKMAFRLFKANQKIREREDTLIEEKVRLKEYIGIIEERKRIDEQRNKHLLELYEKMDLPKADLLDYVLSSSLNITNSRFAFTGLLNDDESVMTIHRWSKDAMNNCSITDKPIEFPIEKAGIWGDCIRERRPIIINDYETEKRPTKHGTPKGHVNIKRFLSVPIFEGDRIVAVGAVANKTLSYDIADADALAFLYDKMWSLIKQQQADRQLQESEKKFRNIFEESPIGKELYNARGELIEVNKSCLDIFGVTDADQLNGFNLFDDPNVTEEQKEKLRNQEKIRYEVAFDLDKVKQARLYATEKSGILYLDVLITPLIDKKENEVHGYLVQVVDITERKELEKAIKKSEQRWKSLVENNPDYIAIHDANGRFSYLNRYAEGFAEEDVVGTCAYDFMSPDSRELFSNKTKECLKTGEVQKFEHRAEGDNGALRYYENYLVPLIEDEPKVIVVSRDITERIQLEQELRESERNANITLNSIGDGVISTDVEGNIARMNPAAETLTGWKIESVKGKKITKVFQIVHAHTGKQVPNPVEEVLRTGNIIALANHTVLISKNGDRYQIADCAAPIKDGNSVIKGAVLVFRDETNRYKQEQRIRESESKLRNIIENSTNIFYSHTADHRLTFLSPQVESILGYTVEEAKVKWTELTSDNPINVIAYQKTMKAIETGERQPPYNLELVKKDGDKIWVEIRETPVIENGKTTAIVGSVTDVTERMRAEVELRESERALEQALGKNTYLMKELNHRVKNNLSMVSSLINLRASEGDTDLTDLKQQIDAIRIVYERLYKKEEIERIDLKSYIEELLTTVFSSFPKGPVTIEKAVKDITISSKTAIPLGLIINEIATNAMKYGFTTGEEPLFAVSLGENETKHHYTLTLSNNGNPFPEDFDFDNSETLGLQLISVLVEQIQGTVELRREPQTTFIIRFPAGE